MLGRRDRRWIADRVFDVLRNAERYRESARKLKPESEAGLRADNTRPQAIERPIRVSKSLPQPPTRLLPLPLARALIEQSLGNGENGDPAAQANRPVIVLSTAQRLSLAPWLWQRLLASHSERAEAIGAALLQPAPVDLRCNRLRVGLPGLQEALADRGIDAKRVDGVATALRLSGRPGLEQLDLHAQGWFEVQDAGSQMIAETCAARRGELVVDFCAGAGGKALALAAMMRNQGRILAFDTDGARLDRLVPRAARAGATIISPMRIDGIGDPRLERYRARADLVLVDAPCSGTGTLRRSPELKWRLDAQRLDRHAQAQHAILWAAAHLVKPGGRLIYATCSLLREENDDQVERFGAHGCRAHNAGDPPFVGPRAAEQPAFQLISRRHWLPDREGSDGFYVAKWVSSTR